MDHIATIFLAMELTKKLRAFRCEGQYDPCFSLICDKDESIVVELDKALDNMLDCYLSTIQETIDGD
ncbi:MAG: hypothetical protein ACPGGA_08285 [Balneolaceae bacterium]